MTIKIKLSTLVFLLFVILLIFVGIYCNKERFTGSLSNYDKDLDLKDYQKNPGGFTGYAFFPRSTINTSNTINTINGILSSVKPYNGYKILKHHNEYIPENGNLTILPKGTEFKYMKTDFDKNANGIIDKDEINLPKKTEIDLIDKFTSKFIGKNIGQIPVNPNDIEFLKKLFINYLNNNSNLNFIALHHGDPDINLNTKEFIIPFFIYEAKLNYTRAITVKFQAEFNKSEAVFDIYIRNINNAQITELTQGNLNLVSATLHKDENLFGKSILDTNGYYTIYNSLGLMFPFLTSPNTITDKVSLKSESEGTKINQDDFIKEINRFNSVLL